MAHREVAVAGFSSTYVGREMVEMPPLNGLGDFPQLSRFVTSIKQSPALLKQRLGVPDSVAINIAGKAKITPVIGPSSVLTADGASNINDTMQKAIANSKLAHDKANVLEADGRKMIAQSRRVAGAERARLEVQAGTVLRELITQRAESQRSAAVAGSMHAALTFRQQSDRASNPEERRRRLGQAAAAVAAGQQLAKIKVQLELPEPLTSAGLRKRAEAGGLKVPMPGPTLAPKAGTWPTVIARSGSTTTGGTALPFTGQTLAPNIPIGVPASAVQAILHQPYPGGSVPTPRTGERRRPWNMPDVPYGPPTAPLTLLVNENTITATLGGMDGLGNLGDIFGDIFGGLVNIAKSIVPAHTIVGKFLNNDVGGAVKSAGDFITGNKSPPPPPAALPPDAQQVQDQIASSTAAVAPSGVKNPMENGIPSWALAAGVGVAVIGVGLLLL